MHSVPALPIVHPLLHDLHFAMPFTGHSAPVTMTPLLHTQVFSIKLLRVHEKYGSIDAGPFIQGQTKRTDALRPSVVNRKSSVARLAACNAMHRTRSTTLRLAIVA